MARAGLRLNERLAGLGDNAFARLNALLADIAPPAGLTPIALSVGEPQHQPPAFLGRVLSSCGDLWNRYPPIKGTYEFRAAAVDWLNRRFAIPTGRLHPDHHVLPLSGTKEGLYLATEMIVPHEKDGERPVVLIPSPFYQVYRGAAVMTGAEIVSVPATRETGFLPDFAALPNDILRRTVLAFLCNPANPQGTIGDANYLRKAISQARAHDYVLIVDECYSEIWDRAPPPGALGVAAAEGDSFAQILVFHSLSKRSNAAGLRVGFVAGDERLIAAFQTFRSYGGPQVPLPVQAAAVALWRDEDHVEENRRRYRSKIDAAQRVLEGRFGFYRPQGGFFLWLDVGDGERATAALWREAAVRTVPGRYLALDEPDGSNPGARYIRVALVHDDAVIAEAAERMKRVL
jgi:aspartate/methionine/tyrosine aminotransferase